MGNIIPRRCICLSDVDTCMSKNHKCICLIDCYKCKAKRDLHRCICYLAVELSKEIKCNSIYHSYVKSFDG